jgi:hypothetical protein
MDLCYAHPKPKPMKPFKGKDKGGKIVMGRSCPKCFRTVFAKIELTKPQLITKV